MGVCAASYWFRATVSHTVVSFLRPTLGLCRIRHSILAHSQRAHVYTDRPYTQRMTVPTQPKRNAHEIQIPAQFWSMMMTLGLKSQHTASESSVKDYISSHLHGVTTRIYTRRKRTENPKPRRVRERKSRYTQLVLFQWVLYSCVNVMQSL